MSDDMVDQSEENQPKTLVAPSAPDFLTIFRQEEEAELAKYKSYANSAVYADHLQRALASLQDPSEFQAGDLVQWKTFLRGAAYPAYGSPAIVVEFIDRAEGVDADDERDDVVIGYLNGDQDLRMITTDSRRLTPWDASARK
ncbi:hypothetical protein [Microbacterium sp. NPDC089696]|uniref:hypothetical protein n=1 Tax=Microbacterium sp. NPDC089696 TaxID=3364199 RepID=UPI003804D53D